MMDYIVGLIIGSVLGLTGAGGSVFAVPLLIHVLHLTPQNAIGVSLGAVSASALFGVLTQLKTRKIQWLPALVYSGIGGVVSPIGVFLNRKIDSNLLMIGFSILVAIVAFRMWHQAASTPQDTDVVRSSLEPHDANNRTLCRVNNDRPFKVGAPCVAGIGLGAVATGVLSGLFGVGGGFLIVPTLIFLTGISIQQAVGTSLVVISFVSLSGFIGFLASGSVVDTALLSHVALGGIIGMTVGVLIGQFIAGPRLQKLFSILMLLIAGTTVYATLVI